MDKAIVSRPLHPVTPSIGRNVLWIASIALVYFAAARLSLSLLFQPEGIAAVWPPSGIFLSALLLTRRELRGWLVGVLFATDLMAEMAAGTPVVVSVVYAMALTGDATLSAWLLCRFVREPFAFRRVRDVSGFLFLSVVLSNGLFALVAAAAAGSAPGSSFLNSWVWWTASGGIGSLLVTPLILGWADPPKGEARGRIPGRAAEGAALFVSLALLNHVVFTRLAAHAQFALVLSYLSFPFLLWAALRFGLRGVTAALVMLAVITIRSAVLGRVPGISLLGSRLDAVIVVQLYLAALAIPSLYLAAAMIERRRVEGEIRDSQYLLRTLVETTSDAVYVKDRAGRYLLFNAAASRVTGKPPDEVIGKDDTFLFPAEEARAVMEGDRGVMGSGKTMTYEERVTTAEGKKATFLSTKGPMVDARGNVTGLFGIARDITDRLRDDEEKRKLQAQLQQAMKMEAVGRLAGGVAHDFNNILTVIMGNVALALAKLPPSDTSVGRLVEAKKAAERAAALTQQLLAFSRKQIIEPKVLDLNDLIADVHPLLIRLIGEDVGLRTVPGRDLGAVKVDRGQFEQILVNLAVNARDAMPGGGMLVIETANVDLDEGYCATHPEARPGRFVLLAVSDTGSGMTEEVKAHLFEPFFTTKPKGRGTGLGVSMAYGAVRQAGGSVEVYSEVGKGTTFKIYLPRLEEKPGPLKPGREERSADMPGGTETVLLVEDDEMLRDLCVHILGQLGYRIMEAPNSEAAIALAGGHKDRIDLLMTDVVMPGMNGRDLAEHLHGIHPEMKVLFTSGYTENVIVHHGVLKEGLSFIGKPYSSAILARKVREVLDGEKPPA